jgi:allophanate hydrolase
VTSERPRTRAAVSGPVVSGPVASGRPADGGPAGPNAVIAPGPAWPAPPSAVAAVEAALARIAADGRPGIWISLVDRVPLLAAAAAVDRRVAAGEHLPLAGMTVAVKDNIDVAGVPTTAACPAFSYRPATSAAAVARLTEAGAVVMGKTNLDQFATGLVGTRSPFGRCPNAWWPRFVAGGSSSGSAVAVAAGLVDVALGTDTAGSGRVPAAANGIVGLKPSRGRISTDGVVPAMASLDCVSVFAPTVDLAELVALVAAGPGVPAGAVGAADGCGDGPLRLGVPRLGPAGFDGDAAGPGRFAAALDHLRATVVGSVEVEADIGPFVAAGHLLYDGAFVAERYAAVGPFVDDHRAEVDPVVGAIIAAAGRLPAWQVYRDRAELARLRALTDEVWRNIDVLVVPTVARLPTVAEVETEPLAVNSMLGTYTNFVNLLDLCALTIPVPVPASGPAGADRPPTSLTLIAPAGADALIGHVGRQATRGTPASPGGR